MSKRQNIVHIIVRLETGGAERSLLRLIDATQEEFKHTVVCLGFPTAIGDAISQLGVEVCYLDYKNPLTWVRLRHVVRRYEPDLVQGWMYYGNVVCSLFFGKGDVPCLWNVRHALGETREKWLVRLALWLGARLRRTKIIFNSETARNTHAYLGYDQPDTSVIPNGIDTSHFHPDQEVRTKVRASYGLKPESRWIGVVGRNHPHKGVDIFLSAVAPLLTANKSWRIALVGPGMVESDPGLTKQVADTGVSREQIVFCGSINDTAKFFPALDCVVVSSRVESFPNVAIEAMACAVPVVGTNVGDLSAIIDDPERLCPIEDVAALRSIVVEVMSQPPQQLAAIAERDRQRVQARYHMDICSQAYVSTYQTLTQ